MGREAIRKDSIVNLEESFGFCKRARVRNTSCPNKLKKVTLGSGYCMECYDTMTDSRRFKGVSGVQ